MLKEERQAQILQKLMEENKVSSTELSVALAVSEDTIRRDLNELADKGLLKKVYGGAVSKSIPLLNFTERSGKAREEKIIMAEKVIRLLKNGQFLLVDGGTTNLEIARQIPENLNLTVATNSIPIAFELIHHPTVEVILLGGKVLKSEQVSTGVQLAESLDQLQADLCVLGICSIHPSKGLTVPDSDLALIKRKMINVSAQTIALTTIEKLDTVDHYKVCNVDKLYTLVTPISPDDERINSYAKTGILVI
jgi:DeoR/GlpR family transcriptional regulator of sugar metabolism